MKDLIRQILREYVEPRVTIRVVGWYDGNIKNKFINENHEWNVNPEGCRNAKEFLENYLLDINPINTCFYDKRQKKDRCGVMEIVLTNHYIERLFRLEDPLYIPGQGKNKERKIINPSLTEGIDLISKNRKTILKQIVTSNENNLILEIKNVDSKNVYNMIVDVDDKKTKYKLILVTQIKGTNFINYYKKPNTIVKVHTLGDR